MTLSEAVYLHSLATFMSIGIFEVLFSQISHYFELVVERLV